jgi:phage N-6-adenine-methyltransferase
MNKALMFSKASDEWSTPQNFYDALDAEFSFDYDAAASRENRRRVLYFGLDHCDPKLRDALTVPWDEWGDSFWLNPPYSKCREFIAKAALEASNGCTVVCLVPSRTDTRWWHDYVWDRERHTTRPGVEIRFIKGRLTFGGATAGAPFPSVVIVFRGRA